MNSWFLLIALIYAQSIEVHGSCWILQRILILFFCCCCNILLFAIQWCKSGVLHPHQLDGRDRREKERERRKIWSWGIGLRIPEALRRSSLGGRQVVRMIIGVSKVLLVTLKVFLLFLIFFIFISCSFFFVGVRFGGYLYVIVIYLPVYLVFIVTNSARFLVLFDVIYWCWFMKIVCVVELDYWCCYKLVLMINGLSKYVWCYRIDFLFSVIVIITVYWWVKWMYY